MTQVFYLSIDEFEHHSYDVTFLTGFSPIEKHPIPDDAMHIGIFAAFHCKKKIPSSLECVYDSMRTQIDESNDLQRTNVRKQSTMNILNFLNDL